MAGESGGSWKLGLKTRCGGVALSSCVAVASKERRELGSESKSRRFGVQVEGAEIAQLRKRVARPARASPRLKGPQLLSASSLNSRYDPEDLSDAHLLASGRV